MSALRSALQFLLEMLTGVAPVALLAALIIRLAQMMIVALLKAGSSLGSIRRVAFLDHPPQSWAAP